MNNTNKKSAFLTKADFRLAVAVNFDPYACFFRNRSMFQSQRIDLYRTILIIQVF